MGFSCRQCIESGHGPETGGPARDGVLVPFISAVLFPLFPGSCHLIILAPFLQSGRRAWCLSQSHDGVGFTSRRRQWCLALEGERSQSGPARFRLKHHAPPFQNALAPSPSPSLFFVSPPVSRNRRDFGKRKPESARFQVVGRRLPTCLLGPVCQILFSKKMALEEGTWPGEGKRRFARRHDGMIWRSCALAGLALVGG